MATPYGVVRSTPFRRPVRRRNAICPKWVCWSPEGGGTCRECGKMASDHLTPAQVENNQRAAMMRFAQRNDPKDY